MDLLERVRDIQLDDTSFTEVQKNSARQVLLRRLARGGERPSRSTRRWIGVTGIVGAATAAAVVIGVVVSPTAPNSAAAEVLNHSAEVTLEASHSILTPNQYLQITRIDHVLTLWDTQMPTQLSRFNNGDPRQADAAYVVESQSQMYVPADQSDDWAVTTSTPRVSEQFGDRAHEALSDSKSLGLDRVYGPRGEEVLRLPGGKWPAQNKIGGDRIYNTRHDLYAEMPRDPEALLAWWRAQANENEADHFIIEQIGEDSIVNLAPPKLRETIFRALALIDGVSVASVKGNLTTLAYDWASHGRKLQTTFTVDTRQGLLVGGSQIDLTKGQPGFLPSPLVLSSWASTTAVVDSAP